MGSPLPVRRAGSLTTDPTVDPKFQHSPTAMFPISRTFRLTRPTSRIVTRSTRSLKAAYSSNPTEVLDEGEKAIYAKLDERFQPSRLQVQDVSGSSTCDCFPVRRYTCLRALFSSYNRLSLPLTLTYATYFACSGPLFFQVTDVLLFSGGCGTFYAITIASKSFAGLPIVKQHRLVNDTLKKEISGIHGLQVRVCCFPVLLSITQKGEAHNTFYSILTVNNSVCFRVLLG